MILQKILIFTIFCSSSAASWILSLSLLSTTKMRPCTKLSRFEKTNANVQHYFKIHIEYCDCLPKKEDKFNRNFCLNNAWCVSEQLPKSQLQNKVRKKNVAKLHKWTLPPSPFTHRIENHKCFNISYFTEKTHTLKGMPEFVLKSLY